MRLNSKDIFALIKSFVTGEAILAIKSENTVNSLVNLPITNAKLLWNLVQDLHVTSNIYSRYPDIRGKTSQLELLMLLLLSLLPPLSSYNYLLSLLLLLLLLFVIVIIYHLFYNYRMLMLGY